GQRPCLPRKCRECEWLSSRNVLCWSTSPVVLLRCLYLIPNLCVLGSSRNVLPEVNTLLIVVDIVQVQSPALLRSYQLSGLWIGRSVMRYVCHKFLCLRLNHVFKKPVSQILIVAGRCDHQVIDPARGIFARNGFTDWKSCFKQFNCIQRPTHRHSHL